MPDGSRTWAVPDLHVSCIPVHNGRTTAEEDRMQYRILGRTGERVSAIGLGGWHLGFTSIDERLSIRIIREAIDRGVTFLDNSWDYNDGAS